MKQTEVRQITKALDLKNLVIGVKLIYFKKEYDNLDVTELGRKLTICGMAKFAMDGNTFKINEDNVACLYGGYATGVLIPEDHVLSGRSLKDCALYESASLNKEIIEGMCYIPHDIYGLMIGPLEDLDVADIVMILGSAYQIMRIMQGYAYHHGNPGNLCSVGNQAMCSDLISKPFTNNDINISFMCKGARLFTKCSDGELGVGLPINLFDSLVDGVLMTINPVLEKKQKEDLISRLESPDELGIEIDSSWTYSTRLQKYNNWVEAMKKEGYDEN